MTLTVDDVEVEVREFWWNISKQVLELSGFADTKILELRHCKVVAFDKYTFNCECCLSTEYHFRNEFFIFQVVFK